MFFENPMISDTSGLWHCIFQAQRKANDLQVLIINDVGRSRSIKLMGDDYDQMLEEDVGLILEILTERQANERMHLLNQVLLVNLSHQCKGKNDEL